MSDEAAGNEGSESSLQDKCGYEEGQEQKSSEDNHKDKYEDNKNSEADQYKKSSSKKSKRERTLNGAAAIIYYKDPESGEVVEAYFEEKPSDYAIESERRKLSLVGGTIEEGEDSLDALIREIEEEVGTKEAQSILKSILENSNKEIYHTLIEKVDDKLAFTFVYLIEVTSPEQWNTVKNSPLTHDAGPKRILTLEELAKKSKYNFAFNMWEAMEKFLHEYYPTYNLERYI